MLRLHYHPLSSYSRKTAIGVALRGDPVEFVVVDAMSGGLRTPAHLALNPFGKMPVLESPDGPVYESTSILEYLEARGPQVLLPAGQERKARHWDRLGDLYLLDAIGKYFWNKSPKVHDETTRTMGTAWAEWENALADGRPFLLGDAITLADLSAAVAVDYAETEGIGISDAIAGYRDRLYANPAVAASRDAARPFVLATLPMRSGPRT
jgi:glutathione S-transferase